MDRHDRSFAAERLSAGEIEIQDQHGNRLGLHLMKVARDGHLIVQVRLPTPSITDLIDQCPACSGPRAARLAAFNSRKP